ncbi:hypothetical protein P9199_16875, partial [Geobacillus stearothermophilus]|uniref:hypothetical protein n=1 Tax=Geobacillus stearothermophilus TaxID=1422 RepID=UPI002E1D3135|nr:hypothetical protein [Geobacillus stearothermophilus]
TDIGSRRALLVCFFVLPLVSAMAAGKFSDVHRQGIEAAYSLRLMPAIGVGVNYPHFANA